MRGAGVPRVGPGRTKKGRDHQIARCARMKKGGVRRSTARLYSTADSILFIYSNIILLPRALRHYTTMYGRTEFDTTRPRRRHTEEGRRSSPTERTNEQRFTTGAQSRTKEDRRPGFGRALEPHGRCHAHARDAGGCDACVCARVAALDDRLRLVRCRAAAAAGGSGVLKP